MIRLSLGSVGVVEDTGSVVLILRAPELARVLVMEVGLLEGRAIAMEAEGVRAPRPLTHDLLYEVIQRLGATVSVVEIRDFKDQTFYAHIVMTKADGDLLELDARPSDAIALALRAGVPIQVTEQVMEEAGIDEPDESGPSFDLDDEYEDDDEDEEGESQSRVIH